MVRVVHLSADVKEDRSGVDVFSLEDKRENLGKNMLL